MSVLAWLFGLGILATAFPLLFHLIRRTPKGQVRFSSLMFLRPSPPRLTKRSRLENLVLLLLRMAAILLIAAAFMRPFLRDNAVLDFADMPGRNVAILLDTSASMQRVGLWSQALERTQRIVEQSSEKDAIAIYTFDAELTLRKPLGPKMDPGDFRQQYQLAGVGPGWQRSDLGSALVKLADELDRSNEERADSKLQIIVVSDMQSGSSISALQSFQWPKEVMVDFETVAMTEPTNASVELLPADDADPDGVREHVLVRNSKNSGTDQFTAAWFGDEARAVPFHVPPGTTRILRVPRQDVSFKSEKLVLTGDSAEFDNQCFAVPPNQQVVGVAWLGDDPPDNPEQMLYYFQRCLPETLSRLVNISQYTETQPFAVAEGVVPELIVVSRAPFAAEMDVIENCLIKGSILLIVLNSDQMVDSTARWTEIKTEARFNAGTTADYAMLGEIDFSHPIFEPFAGPRFNDFTQIRFWKHLVAAELNETARVIARFDDSSPAMWQQTSSGKKGSVLVLATGWQPSFSQLALSSKFLPIINRIVELAARTPQVTESCNLGQPFGIPSGYKPVFGIDDRQFDLDLSVPIHEQIPAPGIYSFTDPLDPSSPQIRIAVNLDPAESNTDIMALEQIAAFDVPLGKQIDARAEIETKRNLYDIELESRQKLWKWLIIGAAGFLIVETWLAGRTDRVSSRNEQPSLESAA